VMQFKFRRESFGERRRARPAGVDERAVNVEENQPSHAGKYQAATGAARFLNG